MDPNESINTPYGIRMESLCNPYGFAYCLLLIVYRLLHNAYCLLSVAYCLCTKALHALVFVLTATLVSISKIR